MCMIHGPCGIHNRQSTISTINLFTWIHPEGDFIKIKDSTFSSNTDYIQKYLSRYSCISQQLSQPSHLSQPSKLSQLSISTVSAANSSVIAVTTALSVTAVTLHHSNLICHIGHTCHNHQNYLNCHNRHSNLSTVTSVKTISSITATTSVVQSADCLIRVY